MQPVALDRKKREILVTIHGLKGHGPDGHFISANLFKQKFQTLLDTLGEADKCSNHKRAFSYRISHLAVGSAEFAFMEEVKPATNPDRSAIASVIECADAIYRSNFEAARAYNGVATRLLKFCRGVNRRFDRIDVSERGQTPIPVDAFFEGQVERFTSGRQEEIESAYFRGQSLDAFDGILGEIDFRGQLKQGILVLSGTNREISCVFPRMDSDTIATHGDKRVWASGNAIYDGTSDIPSRLEVFNLDLVGEGESPSRWKGALAHFKRGDWGSDIDALN